MRDSVNNGCNATWQKMGVGQNSSNTVGYLKSSSNGLLNLHTSLKLLIFQSRTFINKAHRLWVQD